MAHDLKVCSAVYVALRAGTPQAAVSLNGCGGAADLSGRIFQAASLTKPVTAYAALELVLAGALDLGASVARYLPAGYRHFHSVLARGPGDPSDLVPTTLLERITVAQLLNHTSGLPNWASGPMTRVSEPGRAWRYSGEGFVLLQSVIEAVVQQDFASYMGTRVFAPLGMADTALVWRDAFEARAVQGDTYLGRWRRLHFNHAVGAASLYTTASDYARFMQATLANERLLTLVQSRPADVNSALGLQWGLGWGIERSAGGPYLWQWGNNPGFRNFAMASATSRDGFVILTNSDHGMPLAASVARELLPGEHPAFRFPLAA